MKAKANRSWFWGLLLMIATTAAAQEPPKALVAWEASVYAASIWKHTPKLTIRTGQPVWGQELNLRIQTTGRKPWHAWQRYPAFGLAWAHFHLGAGAHGTAWGLLPNLSVPVLRSGRWSAAFRVGTGLGYVTRPYDFFKNPGENALGTHWNNFTQFRLSAAWRCYPQWQVIAGASLSHFSNGSFALPNYGVNLPGGFAALLWTPGGLREAVPAPAPGPRRATLRWGAMASGSLALLEYSVFDGPRYPLWGLSGAGLFYFNQINRLSAGLDYEFNRAIYEFGLRSTDFKTQREARRGATRLALTVADEFLFGSIGVQVLAGFYTGSGINRLTPGPWYSKLSTRYYFPALFRTPLRLHAGITLKAHQTTAEYISLQTGFSF